MHSKLLQSCLTLRPYGPWPTRLLCPWDSPGKDTGLGCYVLLQGLFPTQGWNLLLLCLLHWQASSLPLAPPEKPNKDVTVISNCMNGEPVSPEETKDVKTQDTDPSYLRCKYSDLVVTDDETIIEITFMRINVKVS